MHFMVLNPTQRSRKALRALRDLRGKKTRSQVS